MRENYISSLIDKIKKRKRANYMRLVFIFMNFDIQVPYFSI